jgi:hypothetical protein
MSIREEINRFLKNQPDKYTRMPPEGKDGDLAAPAVRWIEVAEEEAGQREARRTKPEIVFPPHTKSDAFQTRFLM